MTVIDKTPMADYIASLMKGSRFGNITSSGRLDSHSFRTNSMAGEAIIVTNVTYVPASFVSKNTMRLPKVFVFERLDRRCCVVGFLSANQMDDFMAKVEKERMIPIGDLPSHEYTTKTSDEAAQNVVDFFLNGVIPEDQPIKRREFFS